MPHRNVQIGDKVRPVGEVINVVHGEFGAMEVRFVDNEVAPRFVVTQWIPLRALRETEGGC
jgi:hypothetical protein